MKRPIFLFALTALLAVTLFGNYAVFAQNETRSPYGYEDEMDGMIPSAAIDAEVFEPRPSNKETKTKSGSQEEEKRSDSFESVKLPDTFAETLPGSSENYGLENLFLEHDEAPLKDSIAPATESLPSEQRNSVSQEKPSPTEEFTAADSQAGKLDEKEEEAERVAQHSSEYHPVASPQSSAVASKELQTNDEEPKTTDDPQEQMKLSYSYELIDLPKTPTPIDIQSSQSSEQGKSGTRERPSSPKEISDASPQANKLDENVKAEIVAQHSSEYHPVASPQSSAVASELQPDDGEAKTTGGSQEQIKLSDSYELVNLPKSSAEVDVQSSQPSEQRKSGSREKVSPKTPEVSGEKEVSSEEKVSNGDLPTATGIEEEKKSSKEIQKPASLGDKQKSAEQGHHQLPQSDIEHVAMPHADGTESKIREQLTHGIQQPSEIGSSKGKLIITKESTGSKHYPPLGLVDALSSEQRNANLDEMTITDTSRTGRVASKRQKISQSLSNLWRKVVEHIQLFID